MSHQRVDELQSERRGVFEVQIGGHANTVITEDEFEAAYGRRPRSTRNGYIGMDELRLLELGPQVHGNVMLAKPHIGSDLLG